jgi:UDP-glucuronate decarboxylase
MASSHKTTILVTGGAGFIGSNLCDRLVQQGNRVLCLDNLHTGHIANIRPLMNHPAFRFIEHDVRDPIDIDGPIHKIYNLACPASPRHYQMDPIATLHTCVTGAYNVLELARRKGARVLQASTSEVYGDPDIHPQPEEYAGYVNPIGPRACYDEGKRCAETLFFDYHRQYGVEIKVARIFNTYGPRMLENDGRVVSNFVVQALRGEPITLYGDGSQTRSLCYVDDLVDGLERLMTSGSRITGPCNLGNDRETTVREIAALVLKMTGSKSRLVRRPLPQDDPKRRQPVIDRAFDLLGWRPSVALEKGLQRTIDYFALKLFCHVGEEPIKLLRPGAAIHIAQ